MLEQPCLLFQTLFAALQCSELKDFCAKLGYKSQLDQLRQTVIRIQAVLDDVQAKQQLSQEEKAYVEELKEAVYEADDLFDEFLTLAQQKQLTKGIKVRLFSLFTKLGDAFRMSQKVDEIKNKLDDIAYNNHFSFKHDPEPIKKRSRETCSYVYADDIIGREADLENIVGVLLDSDIQQDVSFLSIVGIGGLGKTALAQLFFNDHRVTTAFDLKLWTCVSDHDQKELDEKEIRGKILEAATKRKHQDASKDWVQSQLREKLSGKKYLIVLDDVWTENHVQWRKLVSFLMGCQRGSWIVVTTRSRETAKIVGDGPTYELQGLSKEDSWCLFERMAFGSERSKPKDLVNIGLKIVERCANVPLAIRVAGSLLYGQEKRKWLTFNEFGLSEMEVNKIDIMPILKLSYHQLESPLKSCFGYCALFPKDFVMDKNTLMRLWMAQGYIPLDNQRRMEDVAEEYFLVLLRRCFFQDIKEDELFGDIVSCKMHDLMHDVAQEVSGKEICMIDTFSGDIDRKARHVHLTSTQCAKYTFTKSRVRSFLHGKQETQLKMDEHLLDTLLANWRYLRVLDLNCSRIRSLPSSIGELLHIRYLDVSYTTIEMLPKEITKLYNLETLLLRECGYLKELPEDMTKLVKLRVLDITDCYKLACMPIGIGKLNCLQVLLIFVVCKANTAWKKFLSSLEDLKALSNLKDSIEIKIGFCERIGKIGEGYVLNKQHLNRVKFSFEKENGDGRVENDESIIKELQPHTNLKSLNIWWYRGLRMPDWCWGVKLPNLVVIHFHRCPNLQSLGCLVNLHHLKDLHVVGLKDLEFLIEHNTVGDPDAELIRTRLSTLEELSLFPSLKNVVLKELPKLKGVGIDDNDKPLWLPQLKDLWFEDCPNLTAIVECPTLEKLQAFNVNEKLGIRMTSTGKIGRKDIGDQRGEPTSPDHTLNLRDVAITNLKWLNSLQQLEAFQCLHSLRIEFDEEVESLGEVGEVFHSLSSLRTLTILSCGNLKSLSGGLEHLTALETLSIWNCPILKLSEEEGGSGSGMPWQSLNYSLLTLRLCDLPQLVNLPNWIKNLTTLHTLCIFGCKQLECLPNWMSNLTSLRELEISNCSERLKKRCQHLTGEDWPHIKHISSIMKN